MPTYCIGYDAVSIGDYGSRAGPLTVPTDTARELAGFVLDEGLDTAVSLRMEVDHGAVQPLELMYGDITTKPVIPIFLNCVAPPFIQVRRIRLFGGAVGRYFAHSDQNVLFLASGGLSHDPPVPCIARHPRTTRVPARRRPAPSPADRPGGHPCRASPAGTTPPRPCCAAPQTSSTRSTRTTHG